MTLRWFRHRLFPRGLPPLTDCSRDPSDIKEHEDKNSLPYTSREHSSERQPFRNQSSLMPRDTSPFELTMEATIGVSTASAIDWLALHLSVLAELCAV